MHQEELIALGKEGTIETVILEYLNKICFNKVSDGNIIKRLKTKYVFISQIDKGIFYYKRRPIDDHYIAFGEQNRSNPYASLIIQGQMNLTHISNDKINLIELS
jgi:hypothetical protein